MDLETKIRPQCLFRLLTLHMTLLLLLLMLLMLRMFGSLWSVSQGTGVGKKRPVWKVMARTWTRKHSRRRFRKHYDLEFFICFLYTTSVDLLGMLVPTQLPQLRWLTMMQMNSFTFLSVPLFHLF